MMTRTFLLVLLLLGFNQARIITVTSRVTPNRPFELSFDPGFEVSAVTINTTPLGRCSNLFTQHCFSQTVEHATHFIIQDSSSYRTVQFFGTTSLPPKHIPIADLAPEQSEQSENQRGKPAMTHIENPNYILNYVPTKMVLTKKTTPPGGNATEELLVSDGCPGPKPAIGCINMVQSNYPVSLTLNTAPIPLSISLVGVNGEQKQFTFGSNSASTWMPGWVAVFLANMATAYLVQ